MSESKIAEILIVWGNLSFTYPCIQKPDIYHGHYLLYANQSAVWCSHGWQMTAKKLFHGKYVEHPSDFWMHQKFFLRPQSLSFCYRLLSKRYRKPINNKKKCAMIIAQYSSAYFVCASVKSIRPQIDKDNKLSSTFIGVFIIFINSRL